MKNTLNMDRIKARTAANQRIDEVVKTGKKHGADPFDIDMADKVMRPFSLALIDARFNPDSDPNDIRASVCSIMANMANEMLMQIAERDDLDEVVKQARIIVGLFIDSFMECIQVNYGLTAEQARAMLSGQPRRQ